MTLSAAIESLLANDLIDALVLRDGSKIRPLVNKSGWLDTKTDEVADSFEGAILLGVESRVKKK